jgi:chitodextrinase
LSIVATPAWHSFTRTERRGANLDIELSLYNEALELVASHEPNDETFASVEAQITSGRYYLVVDGVENYVNSDYSDYASTGMYFLEGSMQVQGEVEQDVTPPTPGTMAWLDSPTATSETSISMRAVTAADESGPVEYQFTCVTGASGCVTSAWQAETSYVATGLEPGAYYAYTVSARDIHGNKNAASPVRGVDTPAAPQPKANELPQAVATYSPDPGLIQKGNNVEITLDGSGSSDTDGSITTWAWTDGTGAVIATSAKTTLRLKAGTYQYTLSVKDDRGGVGATSLEVQVIKPTDEESPVKGKGKKG